MRGFAPHRVLDVLTAGEGTLCMLANPYRDPLVLSMLHGADAPLRPVPSFDPMGPQLVAPTEPLLVKLIVKGWGRSWGVFFRSPVPFDEVHEHLCGLLTVQREADGAALRLPLHDPQVLRELLPACGKVARHRIFGPLTHFLVEARGGHEALTMELLDKDWLRHDLADKPEAEQAASP